MKRTANAHIPTVLLVTLALLGGCSFGDDHKEFDSGDTPKVNLVNADGIDGDPSANRDGSSALQHPFVSTGVACLDYPDVGYRVFPYDPSLANGRVWPTCTLNCKTVLAQAGTAEAPLDQALPAGACTDEGATCDSPLMAGWCGQCVDTGGPGNGYTCMCRGGSWHCTLRSPGTNICSLDTCISPSAAQGCSTITWSDTDVCACGSCKTRCTSNAECPSGLCHKNRVCQREQKCQGPDECMATCTGICEPSL